MAELPRKNHKFERFIEGLLSSPSVESAAQSAGIGARTGWRWMRDPGVRERLADLRRQSMQHTMTRLQAAASAAVTTLREVQEDGESESARVSAARTILEMALRAAELGDLEERLSWKRSPRPAVGEAMNNPMRRPERASTAMREAAA
jgi:hypothetical protein